MQCSFYKEGQRNVNVVLKKITSASPKQATRVKKAIQQQSNVIRQSSKQEALATFLDSKMSKISYIAVQQHSKTAIGLKIFPSYLFITEAKKECYSENIIITEISAKVKLQSVINHTVKRPCIVQNKKFVTNIV